MVLQRWNEFYILINFIVYSFIKFEGITLADRILSTILLGLRTMISWVSSIIVYAEEWTKA